MASRKRIAAFGRRGQLVRVFTEEVGRAGDRRKLVRVQWNETTGAPLSTESWPASRDNVAWARAYAEGVARRLAAGQAAPPADRSLRELADAHLAAEAETWAPATVRNFRHRWGRFEAFAGPHTAARLVTEETLDEFRLEMRRAGVVTNQRAETVKVVKQVFRWARRRKLIAENPIADYRMKRAKGEKAAEVPEWSPAETGQLRGQLEAEGAPRDARAWRLWAAIEIAAMQGPRQKALFHLAWDDVNLSGRTIRHPSAPGVVLPPRSVWWNVAIDKQKEERVQPLTRAVVRALRVARVWAARAGYAGPWVFFRPGAGARDLGNGGYETARSRRRAAAKADTPWSYQTAVSGLRRLCERCTPVVKWIKGRALHGFRKHAAGEVHRITGSERAAADWIGDKDTKVVRKHYLKKRAEEQRAVAEQLGAPVAGRAAAPPRPRTAVRGATRSPKRGRSVAENRNTTATEPTTGPEMQNAPRLGGALQPAGTPSLTEPTP